MAISQADFYAFSQATGAPVPEDPESRARIAPQVMEWRRNQLKQPAQQEEGPNLVQTIGGLAAAAGVGTLAFLGGRRLAGAMAARRGVTPVNVQVQEDIVRRAAQPVPQLRGVTQRSGAQTARPPIPRPPTQPTPTVVRDITPPSAPPLGKTGPGVVDPWSGPAPTSYRGPLFEPDQETASSLQDLRGFLGAKGRFPETTTEFQEYTEYGGRLNRALPPAEEEFTPYRPDPKEAVSRQVAEARRQAATEGLLQAARTRREAYQPELPGIKGTLMALRAPAGVSAEEAGELVAQAESRPLSAAPAQQNLFKYVQQAAEPEGDVVDRLLTEYNQLVESQSRADRRAQASVRQYQMELQGKAMRVIDDLRSESLVENQQAKRAFNVDQAINALDSGEDQMTGRIRQQLQRNEDLNLSSIDEAEDLTNNIKVAASMTPDGVPVDQAQGLDVLDLRNRESVRITPRALSQEEGESPIFREAQQYLRGREVDTDFDYSVENRRQTLQVQNRIQRARELQNQADQILAEIRGEIAPATQQLSSEDFAKQFNQKYREEVNPELKMVDNARQRAELLASRAESTGQDLESLLLGESSPVDENMRGGALRGGKINAAGDIVYQDAAGAFASADTGLKTRQAQGQQYAERARRLNQLRSASDEDLTYLVAQGQQSLANKEPLSRLDVDTYRFASQVLRDRAINNPEPTRLQLDALDRARASVAASQEALQAARNQRPTLAPGPQQDVARSMETIRRAMAVEPSEPLPVIPSVQELRTGYVSEEIGDIGPIVSAPDVYTGAAAEAAGPVIFTGKSKANTVLATPPITGSVRTSTGRYLTQDNPDVLGTVYNVAGTPANRAIAAQVERNAQDFLQDAIAGGLQQKAQRVAEPYRTPGTYGVKQFNLLTPPLTEKGLSQNQLGLPGLEASKRTGYAQYQPGRSVPVPRSPFIGEMAGGTVVVVPTEGASTGIRRDIGAPSASIDLTRRGEKSKYFPRYPEEQFVTGMEPAPLGPPRQSPGLSRIGGMIQQTVQGAGGIPVTQLTPQGQRITYPRMDKPVTVPGYGSSVVTNVPRYGINPGAEDWREDLMRSAFRRGGPIRTYQG